MFWKITRLEPTPLPLPLHNQISLNLLYKITQKYASYPLKTQITVGPPFEKILDQRMESNTALVA